MTRRSRICPTCQTTGVPVMFGMPDSTVRPAVQIGSPPPNPEREC